MRDCWCKMERWGGAAAGGAEESQDKLPGTPAACALWSSGGRSVLNLYGTEKRFIGVLYPQRRPRLGLNSCVGTS
jgi:hypothetical protein